MLVLSRQRDEKIIIADNIVITIVDIRGDKVRLGFDAPIEIPIHRQEVYDAIQRERGKDEESNPLENNVNQTSGPDGSTGQHQRYEVNKYLSNDILSSNPLSYDSSNIMKLRGLY